MMVDMDTIKKLLQEQNNTRNFSHIHTTDGKTIRTDVIRSNILTQKDQISSLIKEELNTIVDLRIREEGGGEKHPDFAQSTLHHLPISFGNLSMKKIDKLLNMEGDDAVETFMKESYYTFCMDFKDEVQTFFNLFLDEKALPLAFHCTAGKDRTGILAALFLLGLGASKEDVIDDYMESNRHIDAKGVSQKMTEYLKANASEHLPAPEQTVQKLGMLFEVKRSWIEAFIEGTQERFGSIESYLKDEIMLDLEALQYIYCR